MKSKKCRISLMMRIMITAVVLGASFTACSVADTGRASAKTTIPKYHEIPAYQMKDVYSNQKVTVGAMEVYDGSKSGSTLVSDEITFNIYNSTLQKMDQQVTTVDGKLPAFELTEDFNYIFYLLDPEDGNTGNYRMNRLYIWVHDGKLYNIKNYEKNLEELKKFKKDITEADRIRCYGDPIESLKVQENLYGVDGRRLDASKNAPMETYGPKIGNIFVYYDGSPAEEGVEITFTSEEETVKAKTDAAGRVQPILLEDVNYMVSTEDSRYDIDPFPIAGKDKSEYEAGRYFYDHSSCHRVGLKFYSDGKVLPETVEELNPITLVDKGEAHKSDTTITSMSGNTTAGGMNFKDVILYDRTVSETVPALEGSTDASGGESAEEGGTSAGNEAAQDANPNGEDYQLLDITPVNPHRGELCKLAAGEFSISESAYGRTVDKVYEVDMDGNLLNSLDFSQSGNKVTFTMTSLGLHRIALLYSNKVTPSVNLNKTTFTYNGKTQHPSITVKIGAKQLGTSDYAISYSSGSKNVGTYSLKVTLKGKYQGSKSVTASYRINPKGTTLKKLKTGRKSFKVYWNKRTSQTTGYQIQYSTSSKFRSGNKTVTVTKYKTTSKTVRKLKAKKKYYVRIRCYKTVKGKKYYSGWSKAKSIKTK